MSGLNETVAYFTPTSGAGFDAGGSFSLGMEVFFKEWGEPAIASKEFDVPSDLSFLRIFGGSAAMRPKDPDGDRYFKADALIRVWLGGLMIVNVILKSSKEPQVLAIGSFHVELAPSASVQKLRVEFQEAGAGMPVNVELQLCGMWRPEVLR